MTTVAKPIKLAHFVLRTTRYDELRAWYRLVLQATVQLENPMLCFMTYDDEHHRIAIVNLPDLVPRPPASDGVDHIAFTYASLGDLLHTYARLKHAGITPYWCINHGPTTSLYYRDPDGNQIELQIDNFPDVESLNAWMRGGALRANPIGVDFDPDALLARFERGDALSELIKQGSAPPSA
jgi:catechol-2,3-dioxygenase